MAAPTLSASELATSLSIRFFENGNYEALGPSDGRSLATKQVQPAALSAVDEVLGEEEGFSGLAVQSVGYTKGAEKEKVLIYVARGSKKELRSLPSEIDGVEVIAHVMGKLRAGPAPRSGVSHFYERAGRIACGSSCSPSGATYSGTLGAFVTDGTRQFALSNNHVFAACNHTTVGMPIAAPSGNDARAGRRAPTAFANFESMIELRSGNPALIPPATLDVALGAVIDSALISSWQGDANGYDTPAQTVTPHTGMRVKKYGRTSGFTTGTIEGFLSTPWFLPYEADRFKATVWFKDTWTVRSDDSDPFATRGDSGSLIVTEDGTAAVGLFFAVNTPGARGIFMAIEDVLAAFGSLQLISGHGLQ